MRNAGVRTPVVSTADHNVTSVVATIAAAIDSAG